MTLDLWPTDHPELAGATFTPTLTPVHAHDRPAGAVIVCPGGGYRIRAPHEGIPVAEHFAAQGFHAFVLDYRVAPHRHPAPLHDAQRAIRTVRHRAAEWNVLPDRIAILGFSAGGHVAATAATIHDPGAPDDPDPIQRLSSRPDAAILCYPVINFTECAHTGSLNNLLGEESTPEMRAALSADLLVDPTTPPTLLWHTADDDVVAVEHSLRFSSALARHHIPFALHVYPHGRHGLGLSPDDPEVATWTSHTTAFLRDLSFA